jgi:hypothetical protein
VKAAYALALFALSSCAPRTVVQERVQAVSVPVTVPCVSGPRPGAVAPLSAGHNATAWQALTVKQKAALVAAQGLRHQSRAQALDAATGACQ